MTSAQPYFSNIHTHHSRGDFSFFFFFFLAVSKHGGVPWANPNALVDISLSQNGNYEG